jgi:predicted metal-dependent phosphoesterase TrpH
VLKVELHCHTEIDPSDAIPYSTRAFIDHAAQLGYHALAVTPHDLYFDPSADADYARDRGITLIAGIERTVHRKHVLLLNFPRACAAVRTFDDIIALKAAYPRGLVVAPHAFFPNPSALRRTLMNKHAAIFDAVEINALYTRAIDFNAAAVRWARERGLPLVGSSDLHSLDHLGRTYTLVDAEPHADAICDAIRHGRVEVRTAPLSNVYAAWTFGRMLITGARGLVRRLTRRAPPR